MSRGRRHLNLPGGSTVDDLWRSLLLWYGVLQVRYDRSEDPRRGWFLVEETRLGNPRAIGRGRTMAAAVRAAHRSARLAGGF